MQRLDSEASQLVGCSVRGPSHERDGLPCQDSWCAHQLSEGRFVIAVGDGLGSARLSDKGSDIATTTVAESLKCHVEALDPDERIERSAAEQAFEEAFDQARTKIFQEAKENDESIAAYHTTLLAVVAGPSGLVGAGVGDGGIVYGVDGKYDPLIPPEQFNSDFTASHITVPLTSDDWLDSYRCGYQEMFDQVAVFSDGLEQWVWDNDADNFVHEEFFTTAFRQFIGDAPNPETAEQNLQEALQDDHFTKRSGDDKTLVLGVSDAGGETDQPERAFLSDLDEGVELLRVEDVTEYKDQIDIRVSLPNGGQSTLILKRPPSWVSNCKAKMLLDAYNLTTAASNGHTYDKTADSIVLLEGEKLPCRVDRTATPVEVQLDTEILKSEKKGPTTKSPDTGFDFEFEFELY